MIILPKLLDILSRITEKWIERPRPIVKIVKKRIKEILERK